MAKRPQFKDFLFAILTTASILALILGSLFAGKAPGCDWSKFKGNRKMRRVLGLLLVATACSFNVGCTTSGNVETPTTKEDPAKRDAAYKDYENKMNEAMNKGREQAAESGGGGPPGYGGN